MASRDSGIPTGTVALVEPESLRRHETDPAHEVPRLLAAHPAPPALVFARTIKDIIVAADGGTMKLNEVVVAYDASRAEGAFDAHLTKVHKDPEWYPKTELAQDQKDKFRILVGLVRYFNSSVPEIDVFVNKYTQQEIKLDDFRGSLNTLCSVKTNKFARSTLKRSIRFRRVDAGANE